MVMRPKSMATVVVTLWSTPSVSSTDCPASLSSSSVRSGRISLTAPTRVVLPAPNPPATRIFKASLGPSWTDENSMSESLEVIEHLLEQSLVGACRGRALPPDLQQSLMDQVP